MLGVIHCFALSDAAETKFRDYSVYFLEGYSVQTIEENDLRTLTGKVFVLWHAGSGRIGEAVQDLEARFSRMDYSKSKKHNNIHHSCLIFFSNAVYRSFYTVYIYVSLSFFVDSVCIFYY